MKNMRKLITVIMLFSFTAQSVGADSLVIPACAGIHRHALRPMAHAVSASIGLMAHGSERLINVHVDYGSIERFFVPLNAKREEAGTRLYIGDRVLFINNINDISITADDTKRYPKFFEGDTYAFTGGHIAACMKRIAVSLCQNLNKPVNVNIIINKCGPTDLMPSLEVVFDDYYQCILSLDDPKLTNFTISHNGERLAGYSREEKGPHKNICFWDTYEQMRAHTSKSSFARVIDKPASIKKVTELIWEWNFNIYQLLYRRTYLIENGKKTGNVGKSLRAIANQMQRNLASLGEVLSDKSIEKIQTSMPHLLRKKKSDENVPAPNEPAANMLLASIITTELKDLKRAAISQRVTTESAKPRVYYGNGKWYVRERRSMSSIKWKTSVLGYRDIPYDTLWEAFRAVDHQIDTELNERGWLISCVVLLDKITDGPALDVDVLRADIDSMLLRLNRVRVEDKRLARLILDTARILIDLRKIEQSKGLFNIAKGLLKSRIEEVEAIISGLANNRTQRLREKLGDKTRYLRDKMAKILHNLNSGHYGLTHKIIDEDLLDGYGARYLNEPDFEMFKRPLLIISGKIKRGGLNAEDIESLKRFFTLFKNWFVDSIRVDNFMRDYRGSFVDRSLEQSSGVAVREDIFDEIFKAHKNASKEIQGNPGYYRKKFEQAVFIPPKIGKPHDKQPNPMFIKISNKLITSAAKRVGIKPAGIELLIVNPAAKASSSGESVSKESRALARDYAGQNRSKFDFNKLTHPDQADILDAIDSAA